jgi:hypothetical protein
MRVKCLDNSLHSDQLQVGEYYELESIESYDNIRLAGVDGLFHINRFSGVPIDIAALAKEYNVSDKIEDIEAAFFPEPIKRYRGGEH